MASLHFAEYVGLGRTMRGRCRRFASKRNVVDAAFLHGLNGGVVDSKIVKGCHEHAEREEEEDCAECDGYDPGGRDGVELLRIALAGIK